MVSRSLYPLPGPRALGLGTQTQQREDTMIIKQCILALTLLTALDGPTLIAAEDAEIRLTQPANGKWTASPKLDELGCRG